LKIIIWVAVKKKFENINSALIHEQA
jgi:hypothetical protein